MPDDVGWAIHRVLEAAVSQENGVPGVVAIFTGYTDFETAVYESALSPA